MDDDGREGKTGRALATVRDHARRAAFAVARAGADNTALTALAAGAAVTAIGWLAARSRGRGRRG